MSALDAILTGIGGLAGTIGFIGGYFLGRRDRY